jgi:transcriptional regulator with XRE-family HTH domain
MCGPDVAANVRGELAAQGMTQSVLVDLLQLTSSSVSRRLRGEVPFRDSELVKIADLLSVPVSALFEQAS